jgi:hypothetical protein
MACKSLLHDCGRHSVDLNMQHFTGAVIDEGSVTANQVDSLSAVMANPGMGVVGNCEQHCHVRTQWLVTKF